MYGNFENNRQCAKNVSKLCDMVGDIRRMGEDIYNIYIAITESGKDAKALYEAYNDILDAECEIYKFVDSL